MALWSLAKVHDTGAFSHSEGLPCETSHGRLEGTFFEELTGSRFGSQSLQGIGIEVQVHVALTELLQSLVQGISLLA